MSNFDIEELTESQRSLYAELHSGTLPLVIEMGRSMALP